jgi:predicted DNA-binding WGR domain protein
MRAGFTPPSDLWPTADLQRIDRSRNMSRFWSAALQPTLFSDVLLVRRWGRIGTRGQAKSYWFADHDAALAAFAKITALKRRRGYRDIGRESPRRPELTSEAWTGAAA